MRRRSPTSARSHWATAPVMADRIHEQVEIILQAACALDVGGGDRGATARLTAAAGRLRTCAAHLLRLASTATPGVSGATPGADRPGDVILESPCGSPRLGRPGMEHDMPGGPL